MAEQNSCFKLLNYKIMNLKKTSLFLLLALAVIIGSYIAKESRVSPPASQEEAKQEIPTAIEMEVDQLQVENKKIKKSIDSLKLIIEE